MDRKRVYRAKGTDEDDKNRWYEGGYVMLCDTTYCIEEYYEHAAREGKEPRHHYIIFEQMTDWGLPNRHFRASIRPDTLCMCTEYVKDHKYIFEGDIIKDSLTDEIGIVRFGKYKSPFYDEYAEHYGFYVDWPGNFLLRKDIGYWMDCEETKVIGNIIDNPELMRKHGEKDESLQN